MYSQTKYFSNFSVHIDSDSYDYTRIKIDTAHGSLTINAHFQEVCGLQDMLEALTKFLLLDEKVSYDNPQIGFDQGLKDD